MQNLAKPHSVLWWEFASRLALTRRDPFLKGAALSVVPLLRLAAARGRGPAGTASEDR
ncbi:hypothetical protein [Kitasatospora sp. NPDC089509]|uniref:hypothetical protein n=1 Tax=Kitasatospora sp. NPDC089509 TaxID=3364079 RepID=UPI00382EF437